ncbi:HPP family protein [uncultured Paracoccus sp.]|uniref:HPP family protein n=1 Tax=uncultured Paracoccus sp. TaxID=189685 RepID=UPI0026137D54|nr:HPP family protein [uncultured Paracoccus sp.]
MDLPRPFRALRGLAPAMPWPDGADALRSALGVTVGVLFAVAAGSVSGLAPELIAPLGASAVLVFVMPNSPLAQPWSVIVGSMMAVLAGQLAIMIAPLPWSAALAVALAVLLMVWARALHPPGGAVALLSATEAAAGQPLALLIPLAVLQVAVVVGGMLWARLTGRVYPLRTAGEVDAVQRLGLQARELEHLLVRFRQGANLGAADLARLVAAATDEVAKHRFQAMTCGDIMSAPAITAAPADRLPQLISRFRTNAITSLPVVDSQGRPLGVIQPGEIITALTSASIDPKRATAADLMRADIAKVPAELPVGVLLHALADDGPQLIGVMEGPRMAGVITRSNVVALLLQNDEGWAVADDGAPPPPGPGVSGLPPTGTARGVTGRRSAGA